MNQCIELLRKRMWSPDRSTRTMDNFASRCSFCSCWTVLCGPGPGFSTGLWIK